jgi:alkylated DNA nucleotide flippase Atl1
MADNHIHSTRDVALALGVPQEKVGDAMKRLARDEAERIRRVKDSRGRERDGIYRRKKYWDE